MINYWLEVMPMIVIVTCMDARLEYVYLSLEIRASSWVY